MKVRIGLTANNLISFRHDCVSLSSSGGMLLRVQEQLERSSLNQVAEVSSGQSISISAVDSKLHVVGVSSPLAVGLCRLVVTPRIQAPISILNLKRQVGRDALAPQFLGELEVLAKGNKIQLVLISDLESYVRGVLESEIPSSYNLEAIKAQAVAARTYGLHPRINHHDKGFDVCDSYLCCQYFVGSAGSSSTRHELAINETSDQILTYQDMPALALFSSCAGGHTESYENCFSDPLTGRFPPQPIPYLKGVAEGHLPDDFPKESGLRMLWNTPRPDCVDAWSNHFRWSVRFSERHLEGHMHYIVEDMSKQEEYSPFIVPPSSGTFGHIERFEIKKRGVSGVAISMAIHTSKGPWLVNKELVIRSVFKNPDLNLSRLKSARIFFDHHRDKLGLLSELIVYGFGWGHGVGLQQTGAQGLAKAGKSYREILSHYFTGSEIHNL